jgi:transcription factor-like protein
MNGLTQRVLCPCHHHGQIMFVCTAEGGKRNVTRHCPVAFNARSECDSLKKGAPESFTAAGGHTDSRCRHHVECVYDDVEGVSTIDEFRQLRKRLRNVEGLMVPGTSKAANPGLALKQHPSSHAAQDSTLLGRLAVLNTDSSLSEEVRQLLQSKPGEVYGACQIFFQNVHRWMPIMSQKLFYHRMTKFSKTGQTDFALVLLGMILLIYYPTRGTRPEQLYEIMRTRYWQHNASATASIETVQAGLLLACYEYGSGMIQACYGTTGLCARMGYWMGLHNQRLPSDLPKDSDAWLEAAERCNVWWGIFIRDR